MCGESQKLLNITAFTSLVIQFTEGEFEKENWYKNWKNETNKYDRKT